jgi:hypothetical protein
MTSPESTPDPGSRDLLRGLRSQLERERGWRGRLRSLPTPLRLAACLAAVVAVALAVVATVRRGDLADYPAGPMAGSLALFAALVVVAARLFLRPLQARQPGRGRILWWALVGLLFPLALYLLPEAHHLVHEHPESFEGRGADFWPRSFRCLAFGTLTALPLLALLLLADRRDRIGFSRAALAAAAAGLAGNLVLMLHCPLVGRAHLITGHATVALIFLVALGLAFRVRRM